MIIEEIEKKIPEIDFLKLKEERRKATDRFIEWRGTAGMAGWYSSPREDIESFLDSHIFMAYSIGLKSKKNIDDNTK